MNDLHTNQGRALTRKAAPKVRVANVFRTPITPPTAQLHAAQRQASRRVVRAAQRVPAVRTNNRNVTRLVQRENPQYRKVERRTLQKVKTTANVPPSARHKPNPRLHIIALNILRSGPGVGEKVFGNHPYAAYVREGINRINVTPDSVDQAFVHGDRQARLYAREVPIHEYAHTLQRPRLPQAAAEGGAEAFKLIAAKDIGMPPVAAPSYAKWVRDVLKGGGIGYVTRGQFK